ncbi:hypothetical protein PV08_04142 [Exophiala spinifera]|uniref:SPT2 chromatin protein n=1 Tax=Exophiala spinifera TaxID=91928 RepID=A0A0D1YP71_9EURO|nr:uncharacterized protein PV08_04142 [Exophiala spinifera]KIW16951.1 hypothetical protein PV08_04142 [Exophiala spinifera]
MSFLGDIVNSIGSEKSPAPPKPSIRPLGPASHRPEADGKTGPRPGLPATASPLNGLKRKAEDGPTKPIEKHIKPNPAPGLTSSVARRPAAPALHAPKSLPDKTVPAPRLKIDATANSNKAGSTPPVTPTSTNATAKAPAKGSYADIMARAKQAQEARMQSQVGMIKHQATNREKVSKVAERKRQEEEKAKSAKGKLGERHPSTTKPDNSRSVSPAKKAEHARVIKTPRPPLHAPPSGYKGTMGLSSGRSQKQAQRKRTKYDEYLGTDEEEDDSDLGSYGRDEEEDNYGSDASSDMEAGAFDIDEEENKALRAAKEEDARELALENQLKKEKEERRKRLLAMANKRK